jgi:hypothetical protein
MSATTEVQYFNSFLLKKVATGVGEVIDQQSSGAAVWPGLAWSNIEGYPRFPLYTLGSPVYQTKYWYIEESRIRGGYNNTSVDFGVKAYITESEDSELILSNGIIYSGLYNQLTGLNETNVFSTGENITKEVDPRYGGIQKLYTTDTNLIIFQEDKVSNALVDKDAIYTADGNPALTASRLVLGQINQYTGEYGISQNPESFAFKGYRMYFSDRSRGAILRLSRDGITEISSYGMRDFFRDDLATVTTINKSKENTFFSFVTTDKRFIFIPVGAEALETPDNIEIGMGILGVTPNNLYVKGIKYLANSLFGNTVQLYIGENNLDIIFDKPIENNLVNAGEISLFSYVNDKVVGAYDNYHDKYVVSTQVFNEDDDAETYNTLSFNESNNAWTSFWDYAPRFGGTLNSSYYTCKGASIWKHYDKSVINNRGTFYGTYYPTSVTISFNPEVSISKNFQTVNYEGSNGWQSDYFLSDSTGFSLESINYQDKTSLVYSYDEGAYVEGGVTYRAGFDRRENKYYANLVNKGVDSTGAVTQPIPFGMPGQVNSNSSMSGIKGYFATVKISTDNTTDLGGAKTLFAVSSNFVKS